MQSETREALWVETLPVDEDGGRYFHVGRETYHHARDGKARKAMVTRVSIQFDVPGMHCHLGRVCVWAGESMLAEIPLHHTVSIGYPAPEVEA